MSKLILRKVYRGKWVIYLALFLFMYAIVKYLGSTDPGYVPKRLQQYLQLEESYTCRSALGVRALFERVEQLNGAGRALRNGARWGPVRRDTPVLVVRAARRAARLQLLLVSLAQVPDIDSALLVFSHSFYDENVERLIRSITFCMVLQIYFPYSLQLFPNEFPGADPSDSCVNTTLESMDVCRERDAAGAEGKHHWWWTAHVVFEELAWARSHRGVVVFLDEDSYVLPDLLHMLRYAERALASVPDAQVLAFGRPLAHDLDRDKLIVDSWRPLYDNGLAFNRTGWSVIKKQADDFCSYDDTSWSYSLLRAFEQSQQGGAVVIACMSPRVISTGMFKSGQQVLEHMAGLRGGALFPRRVQAVQLMAGAARARRRRRAARGAGGWPDERDRLLCLDPLLSTSGTASDYYLTPSVLPQH